MASITTLVSSDGITAANSMVKINTNFTNLNTDKIETSVLDTDTTLAANSDTKVATQKAVKAYIDTSGGANASETVRGIVEEATDAEVTAGTATGASGAKLFVTPAKLATRLTTILAPTIQVFTAGGTWTKPAGLKAIIVELVGSGAGGRTAGSSTVGGGGGAGGYSRKIVLASALGATESVTVGAGGAINTAGATTSLGSHCSATGGGAPGVDSTHSKGGAGGVGSNGDINIQGGAGQSGVADRDSGNTRSFIGGNGGSSMLGGGGLGGACTQATSDTGSVGGNYGAGGGGGAATTGAAGSAGIVIVTEYYI